ncbi:MAG: LamG domain-containing protein [Polyangiaceae bacterium]|nr:LamG domain-containing protein [Polyangiaceae bacterium]
MRIHPHTILATVLFTFAVACGDDGSTSQGGTGGNDGGGGVGGSADGGSAPTGGSPSTGGSAPLANGCVATFDGVDDVLVADVGDEASAADNFSVGASLRFTDASGIRFVAGRHLDGFNNGYYLAIADEGQLEARLIVFVEGNTCFATAPLGASNGFVHILGSFASPTARVFINGELAAEVQCSDALPIIEPDSVFSIGRSETGVFPYAGDIDHVEYFSTAVTESFDPSTIDCDLAALRFDFEATEAGEGSFVPEACAASITARVGEVEGADESDPAFACAD